MVGEFSEHEIWYNDSSFADILVSHQKVKDSHDFYNQSDYFDIIQRTDTSNFKILIENIDFVFQRRVL